MSTIYLSWFKLLIEYYIEYGHLIPWKSDFFFLFCVCSLLRLKSSAFSATVTSSSFMVQLLKLPTMESLLVSFINHDDFTSCYQNKSFYTRAIASLKRQHRITSSVEWSRPFYGSNNEWLKRQEMHAFTQQVFLCYYWGQRLLMI